MYYNQKIMELDQFPKIVSLKCGIEQDRPVVVGFSGGPDSLCLLDALSRLSYPLIAAHFDHQLRPESAEDARRARLAAGQLNVPFVSDSGDVAAYAARERLSIEEAARALRYRFLFDQARLHAAQAVVVGHHADDQVETLLMHLLRGTGLAGLSGMPYRAILKQWDAGIPLVRPLLSYWREEILAYCQERGLTPIMDASNQEPVYFRNRLRAEVIPFLENFNPQARRALWRTAQILSADAEVLASAASQALEDCQVRYTDHLNGKAQAVGLRLDRFQKLPVGLKRAVLRQAVLHLIPGAPDVDFLAVERGIAWADNPGSGQVDLVNGMTLSVERGLIWITLAGEPPVDWPRMAADLIALSLPGEIEVAPGWRLTSSWEEPGQPAEQMVREAGPWEAWLDADRLPDLLCARKPRAGDRFQPLGMAQGSQKLSDFFVNQKLPRRARAGWPLVATADTVVWVPGFRIAHPYRLQADTRRAIRLRLFRLSELT